MAVTQLEMRLAPATLVSPMLVTYLDEHSQLVVVQSSLPVFDQATINQVFTFNSGSVITGTGGNASPQQLQGLDLTQLANPSAASGASLAITLVSAVSPVPVEVGFINATGIALGAVQVQGDLGRIDAGDGVTSPGLASLTVQSMGQFGTTTQAAGGSLESDIEGALGALTVGNPVTLVGNINGAFINVSGGSNGTIGPVSVGGSIVGGLGTYSGEISASGNIASVTVGGSLTGGTGFGSGEIIAGGNLGAVKIGGSVQGSVGNASGSIIADGNITGVTVVGSLTGGAGSNSGEIGSDIFTTGNVGPVQIGGNVVGSGGNFSGSIFAGGNLVAGTTGFAVTVGGSLDGGAGGPSGAIFANGNMGQVQIGKGVQGAAGPYYSGTILAGGTLAGVTVVGALGGGAGAYSGAIIANGNMGPVTISASVLGSAGEFSGDVGSFAGNLVSVTVGGSVGGGAGGDSGEIFADSGVVGPVKITGNLQGGNVSSGQFLTDSGYIFGARITSVSITGSVIAGQITGSGRLTNSGAIRATYDIGAVTVGSLVGNGANPVVISARGQNPSTLLPGATTDVAIAKLNVTGSVSFTNILAGYSPSGRGVNSAAQIGPVTVGGNWTASNLVAGAGPGVDGQFGTADDVVLGSSDAHQAISQIGAIVIAGTVQGNVANPSAHYGFVAQEVTSLKVGVKVIPLTPGPNNDHLVPVASTDGTVTVTVNEV